MAQFLDSVSTLLRKSKRKRQRNSSSRLAGSASAPCLETLEPRLLLTAEPTAFEQYMVELVNRARQDPAAEATRLGIDLNEGLNAGTISDAARQPLAVSDVLTDAARQHSTNMIARDAFSHLGDPLDWPTADINQNQSIDPGERMLSVGFPFNPPWSWAENVGFEGVGETSTPGAGDEVVPDGTSPSDDLAATLDNIHSAFFVDTGVAGRLHRLNILNADVQELGLGVSSGSFDDNGVLLDSVFVTQDFALSGYSAGDAYLTGVVYDDQDSDAFYTPGEGLGVSLEVRVAGSGTIVDTANSFSTGGYSILLPDGSYDITATFDNGLSVTHEGVTIAGQNVKVDFLRPALQTAGITGTKFLDLNANGVVDTGETTVSGWQLFIDSNGNGTLDAGEPQTLTDGNGDYQFTDLGPGTYAITEELPAGWAVSSAGGNAVDVTLSEGQVVQNVDFLNYELATITGQKFDDDNADGIKGAGEGVFSGWQIYLDQNNNGVFDGNDVQTLTDASGNYAFTGLVPGSYVVREANVAGFVQTFPAAGHYELDLFSGDVVADNDFGNFESSTIAGVKWHDLNQNGVRDTGEPGLAGWQIIIDSNFNQRHDAGELTTMTDANGAYEFTDLPSGIYRIDEINLEGTIQTFPDAPGSHQIALDKGQDNLDVNFGNFIITTGTVTGIKYHDLNADGSRQPNEPVLSDWVMFLDVNDNGIRDFGEPFGVTDVNGVYTIDDVDPGMYDIVEESQSGWVPTTPTNGSVEVTVEGNVTTTQDFGNYRSVEISGWKFNDLNANGVQDSGEPALSGWTFYLDANNNGQLDAGEESDVSDAGGAFSFVGLVPGDFTVREVSQSGWGQTLPTTGSYHYSLQGGESVTDAVFGNYTFGSISGTKWLDVNGNGIREGGAESGQSGWTIFIDENFNGDLDAGEPSAVTDLNGNYTIGNLTPGSYSVREVLQQGWLQVLPGGDGDIDVVVESGREVSGVDFANVLSGSLSGTVYQDDNLNGLLDGGELGLVNRRVFLDSDADNQPDPNEQIIVTGSDGTYTFSGLSAGTYRIVLETVDGFQFVSPVNGVNSATLASGDDATGLDFGTRIAPANLPDLAGILDSSKFPVTVFPGDSGRLTLTIENRAAVEAIGTIATDVYLSPNPNLSGATLVSQITESVRIRGGRSIRENVTLTIPNSLAAGNYYILFDIDSSNAIAESSETNNLVSTLGTVRVLERTIDLTPVFLSSVVGSYRQGAELPEVTVGLANDGTVEARGSMVAQLYASTDGVLDGGDALLATESVNLRLAAGGSTSVTFDDPLIPGNTAIGSYQLLVRLDSGNAFVESDEGNNVAGSATTFDVEAASTDITGSILTTVVGGYEPGDRLPTVEIDVVNSGNVEIGRDVLDIQLFASTDTTLDATDRLLGTISNHRLSDLDPGESSTAKSRNISLPGTIPNGTYHLIAKVDSGNAIVEDVEDNNVVASLATFEVAASFVDLQGGFPGIPVGPFNPDQSIRNMTIDVVNRGNADIRSAFDVRLYVSADNQFDVGDQQVAVIANRGTLKSNATKSLKASFNLPNLAAGNYYFIADIDSTGTVAESDEGNNVVVSGTTFEVINPLPDFSGAFTSVPLGTFQVGDQMKNVKLNVQNDGNTSFRGVVGIQWYASTDQDLDGGDLLLDTQNGVSLNLREGRAKAVSNTLSIPGTLTTGQDYYLLADIDALGSVAELDETNKTAVSAGTFRIENTRFVDLTGNFSTEIEGVFQSGQKRAGKAVFEVINRGNEAIRSTAGLQVYISADDQLDSSDILVASKSQRLNLAPGRTTKLNANVDIPVGMANGDYKLLGIVDTENTIVESDESNNVVPGTKTFTVASPFVDLVSQFNPNKFKLSRGDVTTSLDVTNLGNQAAGARVDVDLYLSHDQNFDSGDVLATTVGRQSINLKPGQSRALNLRFTLPNSLAAGGYYIISVLDSGNVVAESDKANNIAVSRNVVTIV